MNVRVSTLVTIFVTLLALGGITASVVAGLLYIRTADTLATVQTDLSRAETDRDRARSDLAAANQRNTELRSEVTDAKAAATTAETELETLRTALICPNQRTFNYAGYQSVADGLADYDEGIWGSRPEASWYLPWTTSRTAYYTMLYDDGLTTEYLVFFPENTTQAVFASGVFEVNSECWVDVPEW